MRKYIVFKWRTQTKIYFPVTIDYNLNLFSAVTFDFNKRQLSIFAIDHTISRNLHWWDILSRFHINLSLRRRYNRRFETYAHHQRHNTTRTLFCVISPSIATSIVIAPPTQYVLSGFRYHLKVRLVMTFYFDK